MNLSKIGVVIKREYLNRVKKKSFLITTFVVPILLAALTIIPVLIMMNSKDKTKTIAVVDRSGIALPYLKDTATLNFEDFSAMEADEVKSMLGELELDGVLSISALDTLQKTFTADLASPKPFGIEVSTTINSRLNDALEAYRIDSYGIEGLADILKEVKPDVKLTTYTIKEDGKEEISEAKVFSFLSMALGLVIFLFITLFGGMVMSAVIEEKSSRVVEVLVSSVKATELMFGKIIGIALVAFTQFILWIVLTLAIVGIAGKFIGQDMLSSLGDNPTEMVQGMNVGIDPDQIAEVAGQGDLSVIVNTLRNLPWGTIILVFFLFFFFGYMLYASLYAAIGSAVENEGDSQQLQLPVTIPLMLAYFIAIFAFNAPESPVAFWGSMIPFTSPIVMLARLPFGVENWEIILSLGLLIITFIICAYISAKIYKVGILMFGKKSTWRDLWKWLKQK
ncbi:MAG: ABC transporter permease [Bacteroidales bacterium]|nr:ABC transporter permease [Bacteroidales bacterium]